MSVAQSRARIYARFGHPPARMIDLDSLIAAIEAGGLPTFPVSYRALGDKWVFTAEEAFDGSLDAAIRLHSGILPGWGFWLWTHNGAEFHADVMHGEEPEFGSNSQTPARALLIATLRAFRSANHDPS